MINELCDWGWAMPMLEYGEVWRAARKSFQPFFSNNAVVQFAETQRAANVRLLHNLLEDPDHLGAHIRQ